MEPVRKDLVCKEDKLRHECPGSPRNASNTVNRELERATTQELRSETSLCADCSRRLQGGAEIRVFNLEMRLLSRSDADGNDLFYCDLLHLGELVLNALNTSFAN